MALFLLLVGLLALRGAAEGAEGQQRQRQRPQPQQLEVEVEVDMQYEDAGMSDLMRGILHATNEGDDRLATDLRERLDALRQAPVEEAGANPWVTECEASAALAAELFVISDPAEAPAGISGAMGYLDEFWKTDKGEDLPYPGDFDQFMHDDGFRILRVDYDQLPAGVRKWREEQFSTNTMERKFIAVLDGVAFFPPGVMTFLLPLFATQDVIAGQDPCQGESQVKPSLALRLVLLIHSGRFTRRSGPLPPGPEGGGPQHDIQLPLQWEDPGGEQHQDPDHGRKAVQGGEHGKVGER